MMRTIWRILFLTPMVVLLSVGAVCAGAGQQLNDPGQLGQYAVGHTNYLMFNPKAPGPDSRGRPVFMSVFYPVDAGDIKHSKPAQYLTDPYAEFTYNGTGTTFDTGGWPPGTSTYSTDWEKLGYDCAYEGPTLSRDGPFPLVMFSIGYGSSNWELIYLGTRLASHGYVVAVMEHWAEGQWYWSPLDDFMINTVKRPRDVSFAITQLLAKNTTNGELLFRAIDPTRIAASGWSYGGYTAYTLAGGNDLVCDALLPALWGDDTLPYPCSTCVPSFPDPRIKAIVSLDGSQWALRYRDMARISVPSLIMGEDVDQLDAMSLVLSGDTLLRSDNARPHAAINRDDSYRVDINGANHYAFSDYCDGYQVLFNVGQISAEDLNGPNGFETSWPCAADASGLPVSKISWADGQEATKKYMIAFLDIYLGGPNTNKTLDWPILTPKYALTHTPTVQFFNSEKCQPTLPGSFSYFPYQASSECDVAQKDPSTPTSPATWFASWPVSCSTAQALLAPAPMLSTPARAGSFRGMKRPF
jgi:predicted dienelactone hydrolase